MALYKEIVSWKDKKTVAYYHKIRSATIMAIQTPLSNLGEDNKYAITINVSSYLSKEKASSNMEGFALFSKQYSVTLSVSELAKEGIMSLLYNLLKLQEDFSGAEDV